MADRTFKLQFLADAKQAIGEMGKLGDAFGGMSGKQKAVAGAAVAGGAAISAGIVSAFTSGIKVAANYEQAIGAVAALSQASAEEQKGLFETGRRIGKETNFNAREAADAMAILAQAGVGVKDIIGGATDSVVALSAATGKDLAISATTAGRAMEIWKVPMEEMPDLVNRAAGVALAGSFDIEDLNQAMGMGGGVAKNAGVEWRDFFAVLATGSEFFTSGSDMGTSYKVFLQSLTPKTKPAIKAMKELGLMTKEGTNRFYDQSGALVNAVEMAGLLEGAMAGLSEMEQTTLLEPIFGTDGIKMAQMLAGKGAKGIEESLAAGGGTDAAAMAAKRVDNLVGAGERLAGAIESIQLQLTPLLGPIAKGVDMLATGLGKIPGPVLAGMAAFGALIVVISGAAAVFLPLVLLASGLGIGLGALLLPIGLVVAAIAGAIAIGVLLYRNWDTIKQKATELKDWVVGVFTSLGPAMGPALTLLGQLLLAPFLPVKAIIDGIIAAKNALTGEGGSRSGSATVADARAKYGIGIGMDWGTSGMGEFASGGIVPGTGPKLAIVHGGEEIRNRSQQGGVTNIVHVHVAGSIHEDAGLARTILRLMNDQTQRGALGF